MMNDDLRNLVASLPVAVKEILAVGTPVLVTGCAGFIGSTLSEALLEIGCRVTGVDCLTDYYDPGLKRENLAGCLENSNFTFRQEDLLGLDPVQLLGGQAVCFHLAAQAGVRASWGREFADYLERNVLATQLLLEACRREAVRDSLIRFVYSSSSSVYGDQPALPVTEQALPMPRSPYGVTKLGAEHLCTLYADNFGVPTVSLRYFTVYGPRQRPDMAFRKFIDAALAGRTFQVYGDGSQTRDFTYVVDAVRSNLLAVAADRPGDIFNTGGGSRVVFKEALLLLEELLHERVPGCQVNVEYQPVADGDVKDTFADRSHAESVIGYRPAMSFEDGLARMVDWAVARESRHG